MQVYRLINDLSCMPTYVCMGNAGDTIVQQTCDIALSNLRRAREALAARARESRNEREEKLCEPTGQATV